MPCCDIRTKEDAMRYLRKAADRNREIEAVLCAIMSYLEKKGMLYDVLKDSGAAAGYDVMMVWHGHKQSDKRRLRESVRNKYSENDIDIIKELIMAGEI